MRMADHGSSCSTAACGTYENIEAYSYIDLSLGRELMTT